MSIAALPTPLQYLGGRTFSFYPPIRNLKPNQWLFRRATWSECVVVNTRSGEEFWIPRVFLGDVSQTNEPVTIVSLNRELEWRSGRIIPHERRVIEMPRRASDSRPAPSDSSRLAPVINIRLEAKPERRAWRWAGVAAILGAVACTILGDVAYQAQYHQRYDLFRNYHPYLQLNASDNYASTVRKLGLPSAVRSGYSGDRFFRYLEYRSRRYSVTLMGSRQEDTKYIGTVDQHGRVLDAVPLSNGSTAEGLLVTRALD